MFDKKLNINKYELKTKKAKRKLSIKVISDLHLCSWFDNEKLNTIKKQIFSSKTDYLFVCGDIIDSTNFLYKDKKLKDKYIRWFYDISLKIPIYIVLGNHDVTYLGKKTKRYDWNKDFFNELNAFKNIHLSINNNFYETDDFDLLIIEPCFNYYYKEAYNIDLLVDEFNNNKKYLSNKDDKLKILLIHSPVNMTDKKITDLTKNYDIIFSGHMHNGVLPLHLPKILPGNGGIISPNKKIFPKNVRGLIKNKYGDKLQYLIISGGITKIQKQSKVLRKINSLFYMDMEEVIIDNE